MRYALIALLTALITPSVAASKNTDPVLQTAPKLSLPVDCDLGQDCFIQHYVDRDPGPGHVDHRCGTLSYQGHKGTDFALPSLTAMRRGVAVLAAAPGRVTRLRDGMEDRLYQRGGADDARLDGRLCGNAVVIDHGAGWESQYCHLRRGSLRVAKGDQVQTGTPIADIGLSGKTEFPHLHMTLRHHGQVVDPFAPHAIDQSCATKSSAHSLWSPDITYKPTGIIAIGFSPGPPGYANIKEGRAHAPDLPRDAPALVLWGYVYGGQPGDQLRIEIDGPRGRFFETTTTQDRQRILYSQLGGRKLRRGAHPGLYQGQITLIRGGREVDRAQITTQIK